jgi:hypothetical protein
MKIKVKVKAVSLGAELHLRLMTRYLSLFDSYDLVLWSALSEERMGLSFVYAPGPYQHSLLESVSLTTRNCVY